MVSPNDVRFFTISTPKSSPIVPKALDAIVKASCWSVQLAMSLTILFTTSFMEPLPDFQSLKRLCVSLENKPILSSIVPSASLVVTSFILSFTLSRLYAPPSVPFLSSSKYSCAEYPACANFVPYSATLSPNSSEKSRPSCEPFANKSKASSAEMPNAFVMLATPRTVSLKSEPKVSSNTIAFFVNRLMASGSVSPVTCFIYAILSPISSRLSP